MVYMGKDKKDASFFQSKANDMQRVEFAKQLEYLYESGHVGLKKILTLSFLKGIATGLGIFIGGTIVVALVAWLLSLLNGLPFVSDISQSAQHSIEEGKNK
jgi:hypothetical protein